MKTITWNRVQAVKLATLAAWLLSAPSQSARAKAAPGIVWQPTWKQAQEVSRRTKKPVMLYFHASWCAPCHVLEERTLANARVVRASRRWVCVRADLDRETALAARFRVSRPPLLLFLNARGQVSRSLAGYVEAPTVIKALQTAPTSKAATPSARKQK